MTYLQPLTPVIMGGIGTSGSNGSHHTYLFVLIGPPHTLTRGVPQGSILGAVFFPGHSAKQLQRHFLEFLCWWHTAVFFCQDKQPLLSECSTEIKNFCCAKTEVFISSGLKTSLSRSVITPACSQATSNHVLRPLVLFMNSKFESQSSRLELKTGTRLAAASLVSFI